MKPNPKNAPLLPSVTTEAAPDFRNWSADDFDQLPNSYRIIPLTFYAVMAGIAAFWVITQVNTNRYLAESSAAKSEIAQTTARISESSARLERAKAQTKAGFSLASWIENSPMLQPFMIGVASVFNDKAQINVLTLSKPKSNDFRYTLSVSCTGDPRLFKDIATALEAKIAELGWESKVIVQQPQTSRLHLEYYVFKMPKISTGG